MGRVFFDYGNIKPEDVVKEFNEYNNEYNKVMPHKTKKTK